MMQMVAQALVSMLAMIVGVAAIAVVDGMLFGYPGGWLGGLRAMIGDVIRVAPLSLRGDARTLAVAPLMSLTPVVTVMAQLPWWHPFDASNVDIRLLLVLPVLSVAVVPLVGLAGGIKPSLLDALAVASTRLLMWAVFCSACWWSVASVASTGSFAVRTHPLWAVSSLVAVALWDAVERRPRGFLPAWWAGTSGFIRVCLRASERAQRFALCALWSLVFVGDHGGLWLLLSSCAVAACASLIGRVLSPRRAEDAAWLAWVVLWPAVLAGAAWQVWRLSSSS
jgi:hypothetical protein